MNKTLRLHAHRAHVQWLYLVAPIWVWAASEESEKFVPKEITKRARESILNTTSSVHSILLYGSSVFRAFKYFGKPGERLPRWFVNDEFILILVGCVSFKFVKIISDFGNLLS